MDKRKKSIYDNKDCILLYKCLSVYENESNEFFSIPTSSEIKQLTGLSSQRQQYALHRLIQCNVIERINPAIWYNNNQSVSFYRLIRITQRLEV